MSNLNLKGIWIPIEILTDNKLSDKEKIIIKYIIKTNKILRKQKLILKKESMKDLILIHCMQIII